MAETHFKERACWMNLVSIDEFKLLAQLFAEAFEKKMMLNWDVDFTKTKWIDDPKLGHRLHVVISRPITPNKYLYGIDYREWEKIKSTIYRERRKIKNS